MNVDSAFTIGAAHQVCEDYAVAGIDRAHHNASGASSGTSAYAIISDGCSSSSNTDIGSRLLAKSAEMLIRSNTPASGEAVKAIHHSAGLLALGHARELGIDRSCVDATLLTLIASPEYVFAACSGDGVIVFQSNSCLLDVYSFSYPRGYPIYPSYIHQPDRLATLTDEEKVGKVRHYQNTGSDATLALQSVYESNSITEVISRPTNEIKFACAFTDGIQSFSEQIHSPTSKSLIGVPIEKVLPDFLSFKNFNGAFLQRRFRRVREEHQRKGWINHDDLGSGAIYFGASGNHSGGTAETSEFET